LKILLTILALLGVLSGCMPQNKSAGRQIAQDSGGSTTDDSNEPGEPDFSNSLNFLQNGTLQSSSSMVISNNFEDSLFIRGKQVDQYIRNGQTDKVQCVLVPFPNSPQNK